MLGFEWSAGLPLHILAESEDLVEPLRTWLAEETSAGTGRRVGLTRVAVLPPADENLARERAILHSIYWLAEGSAPQPNLRVRFVATCLAACPTRGLPLSSSCWNRLCDN